MAVAKKLAQKPQGRKRDKSAVFKSVRPLAPAFLTLTLSQIFLPSNFVSAETLKEKIKRFVQGEADTVLSLEPKVKTTAIFNGGCAVVAQLKNQYQPNQEALLKFIDSQGKIKWEKSFPGLDWYELTSDEISSPKVVAAYYLDEGRGVSQIFNSNGVKLAEVKEKSLLNASPNGSYFYSFPTWTVYNPLNVYDSLGNLLWSMKTWLGFWEVAPLSDSLILYWEPKQLLILDAKDGTVKHEVHGELLQGLDGPPMFAVSKNGEFFVIYGNTAAFSFSKNGNNIWTAKFDTSKERIKDAALSPDGNFLALVLLNMQENPPTRREVMLIDNFAQGKAISKFKFDVEANYPVGPKSSISVTNDLITVLLPSSWDFYAKSGISPDTKTRCFTFSREKREMAESLTVEGAFFATISKNLETHFFHLVRDKNLLRLKSKGSRDDK